MSIRKKDILLWLEARGLKGFEDSSNHNPKFLRSRLRGQLLPLLSKEFGKEVRTSLVHLGSQAAHLRAYLDDRT
ncbi:hypothetical protein OFC41_30400, partial [Escherichia coli]|nr:hypothetical protein [Escherichia coli]